MIPDNKDVSKKLGLFRKYPGEVAIFALSACIVYLFLQFSNLQDSFKAYIINQDGNHINIISDNNVQLKSINAIVNSNNEQLKAINSTINDVKNILIVTKDIIDAKRNYTK